MNKWRGFKGVITAAAAESEPDRDRLFGPSYEARQRQLRGQLANGIDRATFTPWKKPRMERVKEKAQ